MFFCSICFDQKDFGYIKREFLMRKFTSSLLFLAMSTGTVAANAYQVETNISYEQAELKAMNQSMDIDTYGVNAKYYLAPVDSNKGPVAEAAFTNKVGHIGLAGVSSQYGTRGIDNEINAYGLNSEHYIGKAYVSTHLSKTEYKIDFGAAGAKLDQLGYGAEIGYLPTENLLLAAGVSKNNIKPEAQNNYLDNSTAMAYAVALDDTYTTLRAKYLAKVGGMYANLEAEAAFAEDEIYSISSDLYLTPKLSVGAKFTEQTQDGGDHYWSVGVKNFFTQNIALEANYRNMDSAHNSSYDSWGVKGTFRF